MEIQRCHNIDLDPEGRTCPDDNHFLENRVDLSTCDLAECLDAQKDVDLCIDDIDLLSELHESSKAVRKQAKGKYNMRKSLAWDSAFFTSAGVLDADELSNIITGAEKGKKDLLPGIQEDVTTSTESISTFESDHLNLEILEEELFVDIRASIQRSNKQAPHMKASCDKKANMEVDSAPISSLKNEGVACSSQTKNSKPGFKKTSSLENVTISKSPSSAKQSIGKQGSRKLIKQDTGCPQVTSGLETVAVSKSPAKQNAAKQGPRKPSKQDTGRSQFTQMTSIAKLGEKNPIHNKATKTFRKPIPTSIATAKQDYVEIGRDKSESGSSKLGAPATTSKGAQPPKASVSAGRMLPRPAVSSKSSLLNSSTTARVQSTRSSTSINSSNGLSSGAPPKSLTGRRNPSGISNAVTGPSGSIPKTLSRPALRNKPAPSTLSPRLSSKVSVSVSPSSSISEWSSVSSSSSSMVIQKFNNSRASIDTSSSRSTHGNAMLLHSRSLSRDQTSGGHQNQEVNLASNIPKKPSAGGTSGTSMRPSGLRLPSPKIGFFDGVKSSPRTPNGHKPAQSDLRTGIPRNGAAASSPSQMSSGKLKGTKAQTRMLSKTGHPKVVSLTSSQEKSHASMKSFTSSLDVKDSPSLSLEVKVNATTQKESPKAEKAQVDDKVKHVVDAGPVSIDRGNLNNLNTHGFMVIGDIKASVESNKVAGLEGVSQNDVFAQNGVEKQAVDTDKIAIDNRNVGDLNTHDFMAEGIEVSVESSEVSGLEGVGEKDVLLIQNGVEKLAVGAAVTMAIGKGTSGDLNTLDFMVTGDIKSSVQSSKVSGLEGAGEKDLLLIQNGVEKQSIDAGMVAIDNENLGDSNIQDAMMIGDFQASVESSKVTCLGSEGQRDMLLIQNGAENQAADAGMVAIDKEDLGDSNINNVLIEDFQASAESSEVTCLESEAQRDMLLIQNVAENQAADAGMVAIDKEDLGDSNINNVLIEDSQASVESSEVTCSESEAQRDMLLIQNGAENQAADAGMVAIDKEDLGDSNMNNVLIEDFQASAESSEVTCLESEGQRDMLLIQNRAENQAADAGMVAIDKEDLGDSNINHVLIEDFQASAESSEVTCLESEAQRDTSLIQNGAENQAADVGVVVAIESSKATGLEGDSQKDELLTENGVVKEPVEAAAGTIAIDNKNFSDSDTHDVTMIGDLQASVECSTVSVSECLTEKDVVANQNGLEDNSPQPCDAAGKENTSVNCPGEEGIRGCKNFQSPKNELSCDEYDTNRSPFALVNQVCIDGSREFHALIGDTSPERELE